MPGIVLIKLISVSMVVIAVRQLWKGKSTAEINARKSFTQRRLANER